MSLFSPSDLGMGSSSTGAASAVSAPPKDIFAEVWQLLAVAGVVQQV